MQRILKQASVAPMAARGACLVPSACCRRGFARLASPKDVPSKSDETFRLPIPAENFETYNFDLPPKYIETTKDQLKQLYRDMTTIRRMELAADKLYKEQKVRGFCHLSIGQEAVAVGIEHAITKEDKLITGYRSHGFTYMRGGTIKSIISELLGRRGGISHGKGGSIHMYAKSFFGGNGIVGDYVPLGTGIAFGQQYEQTGNVTVNLYGDGAANQGQVFESFNMAKLWNLPVIFGCENNKYGMGTSNERSSAMTEYYKRGQYIPGLRIDSMNALAVMAGMMHARGFVRQGNGPLVCEFVTYRFAGHSVSDPGIAYRTREEVQENRAYDPISTFKEALADWGIMSNDEARDIDKEIRKTVQHQVDEAEKMPAPETKPEILFEDIYVRGSEPTQRRGRTTDETLV